MAPQKLRLLSHYRDKSFFYYIAWNIPGKSINSFLKPRGG
ncbi:hypothetical protein Cst_c20200 [Thermoclostridium stercorarium subsp. stercorarium DSM 8532]|uniref:Uncharacterized protein n=1 Tax=Thermoclostridium stercorarium (strain ATCC 35414 / DSM 8532 / NCIMB 11754) TaxID=1121335 RepID=L7VTT7_THES1|nr:hypothetical protein Cst_c20200 [Thermoclostridium stercorarium subsp. stercorarium DSM 8532]